MSSSTYVSSVPDTMGAGFYIPASSPESDPSYFDILDKVQEQIDGFKYDEALRAVARHPFHVYSGESQPNNGSLGRHFTPVFSPEYLHGHIYSSSI